MLSRKFKIGNTLRIEYINEKGRRTFGRFLNFRYLPNLNKHHHFACIVSKQVSKKAVLRNTIRRRIYEALCKNITTKSSLPPSSKTCYDVVILCPIRTFSAPFIDIVNEIAYFLEYL